MVYQVRHFNYIEDRMDSVGQWSMKREEQVRRAKTQTAANKHLNEKQQHSLLTLLKRYESLFDGTLGKWTSEQYDIELKSGAQPYHARPYPIPKAYEKTLHMEVECLVKIGVLKEVPVPLASGRFRDHLWFLPSYSWVLTVLCLALRFSRCRLRRLNLINA